MKENKKENKAQGVGDNTHEKVFWIVGISLIVFLILLGGSLIGLKIVRDTANGVNPNAGVLPGKVDDSVNYEVWEDGTMENINKNITEAEFEFGGMRVSHCYITEKDGFSDISLDLENTTEEAIGEMSLLVKLYDSNDDLITEFTVVTNGLEPQSPAIVRTTAIESCANAARIHVELIESNEVVSGENVA